jgi:hypothetical protein
VGSNREAKELDRESVPDHPDRTALFPECPAYRLISAKFQNPLVVNSYTLLRSSHDSFTKASRNDSGASRHRSHVQQSLHDCEASHDPWLCKLKSSRQCFGTFKICFRKHGEFCP